MHILGFLQYRIWIPLLLRILQVFLVFISSELAGQEVIRPMWYYHRRVLLQRGKYVHVIVIVSSIFCCVHDAIKFVIRGLQKE